MREPCRSHIVAAERTADGVVLEIETDADIATQIASPVFRATDNDWNDDYSDRVIRAADLVSIGMTDD